MVIADHIEISNNCARYVLYSAAISFAYVLGECIFEATNNTVYSPVGREMSPSTVTRPFCLFSVSRNFSRILYPKQLSE